MPESLIPPESAGPRQLSSWKEIAHYLGVNVRTAQKWERERGLSVDRQAGPRSRVSADAASIDAWKRQSLRATRDEDRSYRWPLGRGLTVEVRFLGVELRPGHIDLMRDYLELLKKSLG